CDRFEAEWKSGRQPLIEEYLTDLPADVVEQGLSELLQVELAYRRQQGTPARESEFVARFPHHQEVVRYAFRQFGRDVRSFDGEDDTLASARKGGESQDLLTDPDSDREPPAGPTESGLRYEK